MDGATVGERNGNVLTDEDEDARRRREIAALGPWQQNLHLPGGLRTMPADLFGEDEPATQWAQLAPHVPEDLAGWRVLDVGCNAGFHSFELARRGAAVTGIDTDPHCLRQARWAARELELAHRIEFRRMDVYEVARQAQGYDLVWFTGVFQHLRYPLLALDLLARCTKRLLVFQAPLMPGDEVHPDTQDQPSGSRQRLCEAGWPRMAFIEHRFGGDPTHWWIPNRAAVEAMLRSAGLQVLRRPTPEAFLCAPNPAAQRERWQGQFEAAAGLAGRE